MPKEVIRDPGDDFSLEIGWTKQGDEWFLPLGDKVVRVSTADHKGDGLQVYLSREKIGEAIRTLRRARSQAYGRKR